MCAVLLTNYRVPLSTTGTKQENLIMKGEVLMKIAWAIFMMNIVLINRILSLQTGIDEYTSGCKTQCNVSESCNQIYFILTVGKLFV